MGINWFFLISIIPIFNIFAVQFTEGHQYIKLNKSVNINGAQIVEFFSFYCSHCYQFEHIYQISDNVKKILPIGIKITKYHVDFLGQLGKELTQAWVVAMALGIEDKISPLLFDGLQKTKTIQTPDDIRAIFVKVGISEMEYNSACSSFIVKLWTTQQSKLASDLNLRGVPSFFINGKYMIKNDGLDMSSIDAYTKQFADVVNFLLTKK